MDYDEFKHFRSKFFFFCGREFFVKELERKPDRERPIPRNHVVLCEMIKRKGAKVPDFYGYYNLWRSCEENVYVEYNQEEKRFLFKKKFNDNLKNDELYNFVNYKINLCDSATQKFGKSVKFFKYLCAFTYANESQERGETEDILEKIENDELKIPSFEEWNRTISKVVWDAESKALKLEKFDFSSDLKNNGKKSQFLISCSKRKIASRRRPKRESNSSSNELRQEYSSSDFDSNHAHPEDILWDYEAILNERIIDGKLQFLVQWKDVGPYKFEPSWENESMVNCSFSRTRRKPVKSLFHIEEIEKPYEVIEYYNNMKK